MGRPSKYEQEWKDKLEVVQGWARDGLTDEQIAHNIGITTTTLYRWKNKYSEFRDTLKKGKAVVDREVENSLLKRALGYEYDEVTRKRNDKGEMVVTEITTKQVKPNTTAQIFWLKNRKPATWRDKREIKHSGEIDTNPSDLSKEEREKRIKELKNKIGD